ncbi:MAG: hypothetical protein IT424_07870 [Pirellulales bacterium]|nr:hypothetical protein [Pirellulales bacterium]
MAVIHSAKLPAILAASPSRRWFIWMAVALAASTLPAPVRAAAPAAARSRSPWAQRYQSSTSLMYQRAYALRVAAMGANTQVGRTTAQVMPSTLAGFYPSLANASTSAGVSNRPLNLNSSSGYATRAPSSRAAINRFRRR